MHFLVEFQEGCQRLIVSDPKWVGEHFNDVRDEIIVFFFVKQAIVEHEVKELVGGDPEEHGELPRAHDQQLFEVFLVDSFF